MEDACKDDPGPTETLRVETTWRTPQGLVLGGLDFPDFGSQRGGHCHRSESGNGSHQSGRRNCGWQAKSRSVQAGAANCGVPDGERGRFDDELVFLDLNLVESAYIFVAAVVRCKLTASQTESARASMMVALKLSFSILTLSKPLTYFMRCKCTARQDRDCLDACVDRELLELGDSNRIIVNQDTSSQPRVSKRKTSRSQALPRLPSQRATDTKCRPRSCSARLPTWFFNFCTLPFGLIM